MKTILVADDEAGIRRLYKQELQREGYNVVFAMNGQDAVQKARETVPDLVIMDIHLPGMDGLEAMGRILEENNQLPVVINTAFLSYRDSFLSWCAEAYVTKSADLGELKDTIRTILRRQEKGHEDGSLSGCEQCYPPRPAIQEVDGALARH